jgi:hypothetical protein
MISSTYILSGLALLVTAFLFKNGTLDATTQTIAWCVIFFFASAGASSAYLTVSEIFPMETRAMCIAFFYAVGTAIGGAAGPLLFGALINTKHLTPVFWGYVLAAALMIASGLVAAFLAVDAEQKQLEDIAPPLTAIEAEIIEDGDGAAAAGGAPAGRHAGAPADRPARRPPRLGRGGSQGWSPYASSSSAGETRLDDEVAAIRSALSQHGELDRESLSRHVASRTWGPGCFSRALSEALENGEIRRTGRNRFSLANGRQKVSSEGR